jgi:RND family efflux transporter MFP subunit
LIASAAIEPKEQIILTAPFDGYIRSASARAGDKVRRGQVIAALDDSDLLLERAKWASQLSRYGGLYQDASAQQDRVQINVNSAERDEAQAQYDLANAFITRSALKAPFDGVLVSGDLSQRIGGAVTKGDELFTVAPRTGFRVDLRIKESRIADVRVGQKGTLRLSALPTQPFAFTVAKITPKTIAENGASYFVVEAAIDQGQAITPLQPGMEGVGKVEVGDGWLLGLWTRDFGEWLRIKLWGLFG